MRRSVHFLRLSLSRQNRTVEERQRGCLFRSVISFGRAHLGHRLKRCRAEVCVVPTEYADRTSKILEPTHSLHDRGRSSPSFQLLQPPPENSQIPGLHLPRRLYYLLTLSQFSRNTMPS